MKIKGVCEQFPACLTDLFQRKFKQSFVIGLEFYHTVILRISS